MKVLVISLLRLGDIVMTTPVLRALKQRGDEVHLLVHHQFRHLEPLLADVDKLHTLDRAAIERALGQKQHAVFEAYGRLNHLVRQLNAQKFDSVINLTHTRLSGFLTAAISAPDALGLQLTGASNAHFGSPWFRYLNDHGAAGSRSDFHFSDIFQFALGLEAGCGRYFLRETQDGQKEWQGLSAGLCSNIILVQPFSSDGKKDWEARHWLACVRAMERDWPGVQVVMIGAPSEGERLMDMQHALIAAGSQVAVRLPTLAGALTAIRSSRVLVTVDTAIKHLAAATNTQVVELALGSSDPQKTGVYRAGQYILRSRVECAPCSHRDPCSKARHLCGDSLVAEQVAQVAIQAAKGQTPNLRPHGFELLRTQMSDLGYWMAAPLAAPATSLENALSKSARKLALSRSAGELWQQLGTAARNFEQGLRQLEAVPTASEIAGFEARLRQRQEQLRVLNMTFRAGLKPDARVTPLCEEIRDLLAACDMPDSYALPRDEDKSLTSLRRMQMALKDIEQKNEIELKLLQNLQPA